MDIYRPTMDHALRILSTIRDPRLDGCCDRRGGAGHRKYRHEALALRPGYFLPGCQQRRQCELRTGTDNRRIARRLLCCVRAHPRLHLEGWRERGDGAGTKPTRVDVLLRPCIPAWTSVA